MENKCEIRIREKSKDKNNIKTNKINQTSTISDIQIKKKSTKKKLEKIILSETELKNLQILPGSSVDLYEDYSWTLKQANRHNWLTGQTELELIYSQSKENYLFLLKYGDVTIGSISQTIYNENEKISVIGFFFVSREYREQGLGKLLFNYIRSRSERICLSCEQELTEFYNKLGVPKRTNIICMKVNISKDYKSYLLNGLDINEYKLIIAENVYPAKLLVKKYGEKVVKLINEYDYNITKRTRPDLLNKLIEFNLLFVYVENGIIKGYGYIIEKNNTTNLHSLVCDSDYIAESIVKFIIFNIQDGQRLRLRVLEHRVSFLNVIEKLYFKEYFKMTYHCTSELDLHPEKVYLLGCSSLGY